ncbi:MAG: hypothetical protein HYX38_01615 [Rhodospirillales bacterium]|nr:hypothetical protein [Rhodospirillales bacterium]
MSAKVLRFPASQGDVDLYDYVRPVRAAAPEPRARAGKEIDVWCLNVSDDWPDRVPVSEAELDLFEVHFGPFLDELLDPKT